MAASPPSSQGLGNSTDDYELNKKAAAGRFFYWLTKRRLEQLQRLLFDSSPSSLVISSSNVISAGFATGFFGGPASKVTSSSLSKGVVEAVGARRLRRRRRSTCSERGRIGVADKEVGGPRRVSALQGPRSLAHRPRRAGAGLGRDARAAGRAGSDWRPADGGLRQPVPAAWPAAARHP